MEEEIEDIVGDVKYTDSQKSVATSNQYSLDFTDSSINSDKNNSSGKETYVIDLYDSEDSDNYSLDGNNKSVIHVSNKQDTDTQYEVTPLDHKITVNRAASTSKPNCSVLAQEIFTQTSKTIIELARADGVKQDLETQTSFISISENKKLEYRIKVSNNNIRNDVQINFEENVMILSKNLEDGSSKFPESGSDSDTISEVSSDDRIINIINDKSKESVNSKYVNDKKPPSSDFEESFDSDIEDDSLMERRPKTNGDNHSDVSDVPKSIDNEIEELYTKLSERIDFRAERQGMERRFTTLTPLTEESGLKKDSLMDITPDSSNILDSSTNKNENDDILFTNDAGLRVKLFPERNKEDHFKLPPIQNRSCPNSPHLNFLFSLNTNSRLNKSGTLPCLDEASEKKVDRWELDTKDLASGESPRIRSRSDSASSKDRDTIHLPPIHIEGFVVSSKIKRTDTHQSNVININPAEAQHDSISINEKIRELKINGRKKPPSKTVVSTTESRSCSPTTATCESRVSLRAISPVSRTAERGCEALCVELLRKLRTSSWIEAVDTLDEIPRVMDKFWNIIPEQRIADLIRQVSIHIESPRTQVARAACSTIAAIIKNTNYTKKPDFYEAVTLLLGKTGSFSRPVRRAANMALDEIVCRVELSHAVTALCIHGASHKSGVVRSAAARLLVVGCAVRGGGRGVLRARPPSAATARAHALRALAALLDDKNTDARKYAERLYSMLRPHSSFEAYYLTDVDVEVASRQMKKYDKLLLCGPPKDGNKKMKYKKYKKKSDDKSSVWHYFLRAQNGQSGKCIMCEAIRKCTGGSTTGLSLNLKSAHQIDIKKTTAVNTPSTSNEPSTSSAPTQVRVLQPIQQNTETSSQPSSSDPKKRKITEYFESFNSMETTISRMAALDGIPFSKFCTSKDLRRVLLAAGYNRLPSTPKSIKNIVINYSKKEKKKLVEEIKAMKKAGVKFSLTFDEWTSLRNRRYMNINLHTAIGSEFQDGSRFKNIGLVRVDGSMPAETCISLLKTKLLEFELSLDRDIVALTTDGASVMCKVGRNVEAFHQICLAHGIHLAVSDVLYRKATTTDYEENDTSDDDESEDEDSDNDRFKFIEVSAPRFNLEYGGVIKKTRSVIKMFLRSPTKNDALQKYVREQESRDLALVMDCKTRWSSLADMIERFNRLKTCIEKTLIDFNSAIKFSQEEFELLHSIQKSLKIVKITVEALCRRDATLLTAEAALKYMLRKLDNQKTIQKVYLSLWRKL